MKCDNCGGEDAVIHIRQIIGNDVKDIRICQKCAAEKGILKGIDDGEMTLPNILNGLIDDINPLENTEVEKCPSCGMKREDVNGEGRLGCSDCINAFRKEIPKALKKRSITSSHRGKLPLNLEAVKTLLFDKEVLKNQLKKAIKKEDYESAAKLRDQIQEIEDSAGVTHES